MPKPPLPPDEKERQRVLDRLQILDTPREERFDRLARLAARILDVPIAAISLVDHDRQWFKAIEGLDVQETSRGVSFCGHTILSDRPLVVEDATRDPRFLDNPLVTGDPGIRFYAAHPLRVDDHRVGSLCAIDRTPKKITQEQLDLLGDLRELVERELQLDEINVLREKMQAAEKAKLRMEHKLERFFSLPVALLCVAHPDGKFRRVSSAWSKFLGWSEKELLERPFVDFVHPDDRDATLAETSRLSRGGDTVAFENRYLHKDGSYRWFLWNAVSSPHDDRIYAAASEVTELKRMQALKDEFVSTVSHELRTPLTSIRGSVDLLAAGIAGELPEEARSLIDVARNNCERLSLLINDILDIEKIEAGKLHFEFGGHPVVELVKQSLRDNAQFASNRSVCYELISSIPETEVTVDADRLHQVLTNLLSNAAKFEPQGGTVEVALSRESGIVRVSVADHGSGIPADFRGRIFEKFAQADGSDRRETGGTGLGLSISKAIMERLGGTIGFTTSSGNGTTFYVELPCAAVPNDSTGGSERHVLVCEDDPDVAHILQLTLEQAGFSSDVAYSLEQARRSIEQREYHAVTVDLVLPDGDGFQFIRELRGHDKTSRLPVIVVSARANEARTEVNGGALNVIDWLPKPIDPSRLLDAVSRAAQQASSPRPRILHVEDERDILTVTSRLLADLGDVVAAPTLAEARAKLESDRFELVILDWKLPDGVASELLPAIHERGLPVLVFSAADVPRAEAEAVAEVLVKAQVSSEKLRARIVALLGEPDAVCV